MRLQKDGTPRWMLIGMLISSVSMVPMGIAYVLVVSADPHPLWWFAAGSIGATASGSVADAAKDEVGEVLGV